MNELLDHVVPFTVRDMIYLFLGSVAFVAVVIGVPLSLWLYPRMKALGRWKKLKNGVPFGYKHYW